MRCPLKKIIFLLLLLVSASNSIAFNVLLETSTVREGSLIRLTISSSEKLKAANLFFMEKRYPAFFKEYNLRDREYIYYGYAPVPLDTKGVKTLTVKVSAGGAAEIMEKKHRIKILPLSAESSVVNTGGQMNKQTLSNLRSENVMISKLQDKITAVKYKTPFIMPVDGQITSTYAKSRVYDSGEAGWRHKGIDIAAKTGTPVRAGANGRVAVAASTKAHGYTVIIDHGGGVYSLYFHNSKLYVKTGARVSAGDIIAAVGSTGISTGPHLHWQINVFKVPVNPKEFISIN